MKRTLCILALFLFFAGPVFADPAGVTIKKIWDVAPHSAFTDLTTFKGEYYCTFREGTGHIPGKKTGEGDGEIRVIRSKDGETWQSVALLKKNGYDLRDSKISETPDGRLMLTIGGTIYINQTMTSRHPQVSFSDKNGENFSDPVPMVLDSKICSTMDWVWRVTWQGDTGYAVVYQDWSARGIPWVDALVSTKDGIHYDLVNRFDTPLKPNEATVRFDSKGEMHILLRREQSPNDGLLGHAKAPFTDWEWKSVGKPLGGPNFIFLPSGKILVGSRTFLNGIGTALFKLDAEGKMVDILRFPSGGDTGYPGMEIVGKELWVSYYSGHEGKTSIYLAKVPLEEIEKALQ